MLKIMLIGSFAGKNLGDNAVLHSIIQQFEGQYGKKNKIYIPCNNVEYIQKEFANNENIIPININRGSIRFFGFQTLITLFKIDVIVTTAGILFDYNSRSFKGSNFVVSLTPLFIIARILNKKIIGLNVGIINNKTKGEWFLKKVLKLHDVLYLRDYSDKHVLKDMNLDVEYIESADIVFSNQLFKKHLSKIPCEEEITIGVNLNKYINRYSDDTNMLALEDFVNIITVNLDKIVETYSCKIYFFPTAQMDVDIHRKVINQMKYKENCKLIFKNNTEDFIEEISKVKLFIGMRMHSLIFATMLKKPVISLNYSPKVKGFMRQIGFEGFSNDIETLTSNKIFLLVTSILKNLDYFSELQEQNTLTLEKKALKSFESFNQMYVQ